MKLLKEKIKKYVRIAILALVINLFMLFIVSDVTSNKSQYMENLDYNVIINKDGSMKVTEIWDINIEDTNTIFKNFEMSNSFGEIKDVTVKDLQIGKNLTKINEEMYHVTTDCFYALKLSRHKFEIAWGTGMEKKSGRRKYEITYTVTDVITDYYDCQEMYWKFLDIVNEIPVKNVNIKITLPKEVKDINNLLVWGHGPLNGIIKKTNNNTVDVSLKNLSPKKMLEVRVVTKEKMFNNISTNKIRNYQYLDKILKEETKWSEEANNASNQYNSVLRLLGIIYAIIIIIQIIKIVKHMAIYKKKDDGKVYKDLKYYRDIPREDESTPAEANYLYTFNKESYRIRQYQGDILAATILNLCLKGYIELTSKDKEVYIKILNSNKKLAEDEKQVYQLLKNVAKGREEFEIQELNNYAKKQYYAYSDAINNIYRFSRNKLYSLKLLNKLEYKEYAKIEKAKSNYSSIITLIRFLIIMFIIGSVFFEKVFITFFGIGYKETIIKIAVIILPYVILKLIDLKIFSKLSNKIAILTQKRNRRTK